MEAFVDLELGTIDNSVMRYRLKDALIPCKLKVDYHRYECCALSIKDALIFC